jgi:D-glycero-D-manno-heptose 1,7-bisphosphate phosphatase
MGRRAVFLDRDGVINANVFYADTGETEAPRTAADFQILPGALEAMKRLQDAGYLLFVVSNQPNQAKRKATRADHEAIQSKLTKALDQAGVKVEEFFYCFHHPKGLEPALSGPCDCRKPSPYFLNLAWQSHDLDMAHSWMVGDREADIACGLAAGVQTIRIVKRADNNAAYTAADLKQAVQIIDCIDRNRQKKPKKKGIDEA